MTKTLKASDDPRYATLLNAFEAFQQQSTQLEQSHKKLKEQLKHSQIDLAEKNKELANKVTEVQDIKERLSSILESITDAVFMIDKEGLIVTANQAACKFFEAEKYDELDKSSLTQINEIMSLIKAGKKIQDKDLSCNIHDEEKVFMLSILPIKKSQDR